MLQPHLSTVTMDMDTGGLTLIRQEIDTDLLKLTVSDTQSPLWA